MKKRWLIPLLFLLLALPGMALAAQAKDITDQCTITATRGKFKLTRMTDRDWGTTYVTSKEKSPYVALKAPSKTPIYGVYVCFGDKLIPWEVQAKRSGKWVTVYTSEGKYAHEYAKLKKGETEIRIRPTGTKQVALTISEIFAYGKGTVPSSVQQWQDAPKKADLLVISAHPDDEILFLGGAIPTYAGERKMNVVVAYMTCGTMERRSELLNGLWEMGVRTYPVIGDFWDKYSKKLDTAYGNWGKTKTQKFVVELYRRFQPEVVLTHDVNGEYGHGAHRVCADAAKACIALAADSAKYSDTAQQYGVWQVKKLYLHLYKENTIEMDWDQPLTAFDGRTGFEVAKDAYAWHDSQHNAGQKNPKTGKFEVFVVEPRDSDYSCYRFGLAFTDVGEDVAKNDFFENVPGYEVSTEK
ncbi:MAG: PIG-L family deacetylase [Clostridia bacterium]|nr:PIG-L family deacetylase [Clostridia bacterium]